MDLSAGWSAYFAFALLGALCSFIALMYVLSRGHFRSTSSQLHGILHLSLFLEEIATLPFAYLGNHRFCAFMGWLHTYSGLSNIMAASLLTLFYLNMMDCNEKYVWTFIRRQKFFLPVIFPLITLLPFITGSYGVSYEHWCSIETTSEGNVWSIVVFYMWAWLMLFLSVSLIIYVYTKQLKREVPFATAKKIVSAGGIYVLVCVLCWAPRTVPRIFYLITGAEVLDHAHMWTVLPLYLSGILFLLILVKFRRNMSIDTNFTMQLPWDELNFDEITSLNSTPNSTMNSAHTSVEHHSNNSRSGRLDSSNSNPLSSSLKSPFLLEEDKILDM